LRRPHIGVALEVRNSAREFQDALTRARWEIQRRHRAIQERPPCLVRRAVVVDLRVDQPSVAFTLTCKLNFTSAGHARGDGGAAFAEQRRLVELIQVNTKRFEVNVETL
jgi:hypothetical protein